MDKLIHVKQSDKGVDDELHRIVQAVNHIADLIVEPSTSRPSDRDKSLMQVMTTENNEYAVAFRTKDGYVCSVPGMFEKSDGLALNINASRSYGGVLSGIEVVQQGLATVVEISDVLVVKEAARDAKWGHYYPTALADVNSTESTKLAGIAAGATVGATWGTDLNSIPARISGLSLPEPCVAITENFIGFYQSGTVTDPANWPVAIYNDSGVGKFYLKDTSGGNTTLISAGATAFACGPTSAPTVTITQAGVLTALGSLSTGTTATESVYITNESGRARALWKSGTTTHIIIGSDVPLGGWGIQLNGSIAFGTINSEDVNLYRGGANILKTDDTFDAVALTISGVALNAGHLNGVTTIGQNIFELTNPSAITFLRMNADNSVSALSAANFKTALSLTAADVEVSFGSYNSSGVYASKTSGGATDDQVKVIALTIGATTVQVLTDQWVT